MKLFVCVDAMSIFVRDKDRLVATNDHQGLAVSKRSCCVLSNSCAPRFGKKSRFIRFIQPIDFID